MLRGGGDEMSHYEIGGSLGGSISETFDKNFITSAICTLHVERNLHSLLSQKQSIHRYRYNR